MASNQTSQPVELLLSVTRGGRMRLGAQIEDQLRCAIRKGAAKPGTRIPSTRDLARQIGVSRHVVVEAYAQLATEGYLSLRQGAPPRVSDALSVAGETQGSRPSSPLAPRFDFRPSMPDVSAFPRTAWLRAMREAITTIPDADLQYGDPAGVEALQSSLSSYLGRVRGVVADPARVVVTSGYTQSLALVCRALAARGSSRVAFEDPTDTEYPQIASRAGLEPVSVPVDDDGLQVDRLARTGAEAVVVTPAHQHPTGAVLSGERRAALLRWLREHDAVAIEDDYDAEYRYDRGAIGSLQGLEPNRVVYAGSASKTLAPALRLGWLVLPPRLLESVRQEKMRADHGSARIQQRALASFLERGDLDRHLRRMRARYRTRRDLLVDELARAIPGATVRGIAAGLHLTVELPAHYDEPTLLAEAAARRVAFNTMRDYRTDADPSPPLLMLGYGQISESAIRAGVREIAEAINAATSPRTEGARP